MLPPGQWLFVHDLANCADGTASGAVALAQAAGVAGLLVKWSDGGSLYGPGRASALLRACRPAGLGCSAWGYTYPGDGANVAALVQQWLQLSGDQTFLLDAEVEFERAADPAGAAGQLLSAVSAVCRPWYTSLPWPDQQAPFPWAAFQSAAAAYAPQVYFADLAGRPGPVGQAWADLCWNRAAIGPSAGGPAYTTGGPAGWEGLSPRLPVVPVFDLSNVPAAAALAHNAGLPAICWWLLDGLTTAQAAALAQTPYARPEGPTSAQPAAATPDLAEVASYLGTAQAALASAQKALQ